MQGGDGVEKGQARNEDWLDDLATVARSVLPMRMWVNGRRTYKFRSVLSDAIHTAPNAISTILRIASARTNHGA